MYTCPKIILTVRIVILLCIFQSFSPTCDRCLQVISFNRLKVSLLLFSSFIDMLRKWLTFAKKKRNPSEKKGHFLQRIVFDLFSSFNRKKFKLFKNVDDVHVNIRKNEIIIVYFLFKLLIHLVFFWTTRRFFLGNYPTNSFSNK